MSPVYTPRGLKIRLGPDFCFPLLARLQPHVKPDIVLRTVEALTELPVAVSYVAAGVCFALGADALTIAVATASASVGGLVVTMFGLYMIPGIVGFARAFSRIPNASALAGIVALGLVTVGWSGPVAFVVGRLGGFLVRQVMEIARARSMTKNLGLPLTMSEIDFINAYRLHAAAHGVTADVSLSNDEVAHENWAPTLALYLSENPQIHQLMLRS